MSIRHFTIPGYTHLYRSLLRFCKMGDREAKELVYLLNTANLDSIRYTRPYEQVMESSPVAFSRCMDRLNCRPYRTEVQLYKALAALKRNIIYNAITSEQREAVSRLRCIMRDLDFYFYKTFGLDIDDMLTVYANCGFGLVPHDSEPSVCLAKDWILLPSA